MPEEPILETETGVVEDFVEPEAGIMPLAEESGVMSTPEARDKSGEWNPWG